MDEDGSNKKQITNLPTNCYYPRWSPDGRNIVFQTDDFRIFFVEGADTDNPEEPYFVFGGSNPSFTGLDDEIMFNSDHDDFLSIYMMQPTDPDAYLVSVLGYSNQQILSNDGTELVFSCIYEGQKSIFIMDLEDTTDNNIEIVSINENANIEPDISSDGNMFVYASFNNQLKGTIYIFRDNGEEALTKGIPSSNQPEFSPDDDKIGFIVIDNLSTKLYTMDLDGSNRKNINITGGNVGRFMWMDNERILYSAGSGDNYLIGIVNTETGENDILANGGINMSPDFVTLVVKN
jgi:Tol biopolymer transport system component